VMTTRPIIGLDTNSFGHHWVSNVPLLGYLYGTCAPGEVADSPGTHVGWSKARGAAEERYPAMFAAARNFFRQLPDGTYIFCEEPLALPRNGKTTRMLGISAGVIYGGFVAACDETDLTWFWVDVASWKRAVIGNGSAKKELIRSVVRESPEWLMNMTDYDDEFEDQRDLYDAWSLMRYGVENL
jgi:Holliday junction resolvasome RuvABC endonuclease subunit